MSTGLKKLAEMAASAGEQIAAAISEIPDTQALPPYDVSPEAHRVLAQNMRRWSGWADANLVIGLPKGSPYAECDHVKHTFTVNVDALGINPNRVLHSPTPFRLRQEAVLTGAMLHEAGHARYSRWLPRTEAQAKANPLKHYDRPGEPTNQAVALARLAEEARIEGVLAANEIEVGAGGLGWTMRASAAHLLPMTRLAADPNQQIMDLITSWVLRAGRQVAIGNARTWVGDFHDLLIKALIAHLEATDQDSVSGYSPDNGARFIMHNLMAMVRWDGKMIGGSGYPELHTGPYLVDKAAAILDVLFPGQDGNAEDAAMPSGGCSVECEDSPDDQPDDQAAEGDGPPSQVLSDLANLLASVEANADVEVQANADVEAEKAPAPPVAMSISGSDRGAVWRQPTAEDRLRQREAEKFLRDLIDSTERSVTTITDTPSTQIDGAAYAAWRAGGRVQPPRFFKQTRRSSLPAPPVKIATLVDVSGSMDVLQEPAALLSWALSSAALDLRNFAGRGVQVESTLIHWGTRSRVIQANGDVLPGIITDPCIEGTDAMGDALAQVAEQIPGFFEPGEKHENRLLVHFTDWDLSAGVPSVIDWTSKALAAGVNMISVVPTGYSTRRSNLDRVLAACTEQRGLTSLVKYQPHRPEMVWSAAAEALNR